MPSIQSMNSNLDAAAANKNYGYTYPRNSDGKELDWRPNSELHHNIVQELMMRANESKNSMSARYEGWKKIDRNMTAFIPLNEMESAIKNRDSRKAVPIVLPLSYAIRETILTYLSRVFFDDIVFPYRGVGPEDTVGAILLSHHVQQQFLRAKSELALYTQWSDAITYGLGVALPYWFREIGPVTRTRPIYDTLTDGTQVQVGEETYVEEDSLLFEGSRIRNADTYKVLPDPNTPIHLVQESEYISILSKEGRMDILGREKAGTEGIFNARYLVDLVGQSMLDEGEDGRTDKYETVYNSSTNVLSNPVDVLYTYINLVPEEWGLGNGKYPEKWMFGLANDSLIIQAQPINLDHRMFPVSIAVPDLDGHSIIPTSRMEILYGMQETVDWYQLSRINNVRKTHNNVYVVDPFRINMNDVTNPQAGGIMRTRRASWGQGVEGAIKQLTTQDMTENHARDIMFMSNMMQQVSGVPDFMQGMLDSSAPERRTAAEFQGVRSGAGSRMARIAKFCHITGMRDLGMMLASHTIQFQQEESAAKMTGDWERVLVEEYGYTGIDKGFVTIRPEDMDIRYDLEAIDGTLPADQDGQLALQLMQMAMSSPLLASRFDVTRMFSSMARRFGEKNMKDFEIRGQSGTGLQVQPQILPDEQAAELRGQGGVAVR